MTSQKQCRARAEKGNPNSVLQGGNFQGPNGSVNPKTPDPAVVPGVHGLGRGPESIHSIQEVRRVIVPAGERHSS